MLEYMTSRRRALVSANNILMCFDCSSTNLLEYPGNLSFPCVWDTLSNTLCMTNQIPNANPTTINNKNDPFRHQVVSCLFLRGFRPDEVSGAIFRIKHSTEGFVGMIESIINLPTSLLPVTKVSKRYRQFSV